MTIPHPTYRAVANFYPVALIAALISLCWMGQRHQHAVQEYADLEHTLKGFFHSARDEAQEAFAAGDFQRAAALLDPTVPGAKADSTAMLLRARSLECLGYFPEAAKAYTTLEQMPGRHLAILRGKAFCQRMASERIPARVPSKEVLYRLHDELMRRGDPASARFVARKLLPDVQPLRASLRVLLHNFDAHAELVASADAGLVDVTVTRWDPQMLDLLRDLRIGSLNIAQSNLEDTRVFTGLDVCSLNLSDNRLGDLTPLRTLPLRQLRLDHTNTADVRPLAGLPLRELHLSHTLVSSIQSLSLCPLQKLDLSHTAVRSIDALRGMELRELNLSHTHVTDLSALTGMPLERLAVDGTSVHDLRAIAGAQLKYLSVAGTAIKDIDALADMPLTELDLRGCELLTDVQVLTRCPRLERVYLPRQLKAPADHWQLPRLRFIETERQPESAIAQK
ncbi:MAG: hypothetical protein ABJF10_10895 [Chthoniobacter sp.]|uniref:hypothetical protein n=1 Tax=Chthoniobacter sp. TaxID=2510640 RepID=UPI0032A1688A